MSTISHFGKGALRVAKNYTKGYSDTQAKVRDATSNDPWPPSGAQLNELAQLSYNQNDFVEILEMLDKRLNDKGKNWRHVFKSLTVVDYLLHSGSENVIVYFRDNIYVIKTLKEFQYVDEDEKDQGANVRQKAKDISNLLSDEQRLKQLRNNRAQMRDRMMRGGNAYDGDAGNSLDDDENRRRRSRSVPPGGSSSRRGEGGEDDQLKKAIEASKRSLAEEQARKNEEKDIERAIALSKEEDAKRLQALADANAASLFDDQQQLQAPAAGQTNPFPLVDASQPQFTNGLNPQFTQVGPQFTAFNPWQQQAQQEAMQAEYMRQQAEWMRQQQQQQELQAQQQAAAQQAQQEEWMRQQQMLQYQQQLQVQPQPMLAQPTGFGSNNPFAPPSFSSSSLSQQSSPVRGTTPVSFNLPGTFAGRENTASAPPASERYDQQQQQLQQQQRQQAGPTRADQEHAHLASLFAGRGDDGIDTFGNVGQLRYGPSQAGRVAAQKTGAPSHNPFAQFQQPQQQHGNDQPFFQI
ncbi:hypothetical protein JAAARDRAFT_38265 [Jaapia argillacea MUCL 33604]|uniref:ENTH domain-containing protein n=1 Tax=Jaapia argillacea MUCL 33604 TaxID=933084 RepID=A0A067PIG6_9AGAM|nr:hypothetical protein JAAARDRAFT_38265 [Jaapia argillacea MUCL 33604]